MTELEKLEKEFEDKKIELMMKKDILLKLNDKSSMKLTMFSTFISFTECSIETTKKILDTFVADDWFIDTRGISKGYGRTKDRAKGYTDRTEMEKTFPYQIKLDSHFGTTIHYPATINGAKFDIHIQVKDSSMLIQYSIERFTETFDGVTECYKTLKDCRPIAPECFTHRYLKVQTWGSVDHHPHSYTYYMTAPQENELALIKHFVDCICSEG